MSETSPPAAGVGERGEEGSEGEEVLIGMAQAQAHAQTLAEAVGASGGEKVEKEGVGVEARGAQESPRPGDPTGARDLTPTAARLVSDLKTRDVNILKVLAVSKIPCPVCVDLEIGMWGRLYAGYSQALQHACDYKYHRSKGVREHSELVAAAEEALHSRRLRLTHHGLLPLYDLSRRSIPLPGDASGSTVGAAAHTHAAARNTGAATSAAASNGGTATSAAVSNSDTAVSPTVARTTTQGMGSIEDATSSTPSSIPGSAGGGTPRSAPQAPSSAQESVAVPVTTSGSGTGDAAAGTTAGATNADITAGTPACRTPLAVSTQARAEGEPVQETVQKGGPLIERTSQEEGSQIEGIERSSQDRDVPTEGIARVVEAHETLKESQGQAEGSALVEAKLAGGHTAQPEGISTNNTTGSTTSTTSTISNSTTSNTSSSTTTSNNATGNSSSTPQKHSAVPGRPPPAPRIKDPTGARDLTPFAARMVAKLRALDLNTLKAMALPTYQCPVCVDLQIVDWDGRTYTGCARVLQHACTYKHHRLKGVQEHSDFVAAAEEALHARRLRISHLGIYPLHDLSRRSIPFLGDAAGPAAGNGTATAAPAAEPAAARNTGIATTDAVTPSGTNQATKDAIRTPLTTSAPSTAGSSTPSSAPQPPIPATRYVPPPLSKGNVPAAQGSVAASAPSAGGSGIATSASVAGATAGAKIASLAAGTAARNTGDHTASITGAGASTAGNAASIAGAGNAAPTPKSTAPPHLMTPDVASAKRFLEGMRRHSTESLLYVATRKPCFCPLCYHHGKLATTAYLPQPPSQPQPGSAAQAQAVSVTGTPGGGPQSTSSPPSANGHSAPAAPAAPAGTVTAGNVAGATGDGPGGTPGPGEGATAFLSAAGGPPVKMYPRLPALLHHCFHLPPGSWRQVEHLWLAGEIDGVLAERGLREDQVGVYRGAAWEGGHRKGFPLPSELKGTPYDVGLPGLPRQQQQQHQQQRADPGAHAGAGIPGSRGDGDSGSSGAPSGGGSGPKPAASGVAGTGPAVAPGAPPQGPAASSPGKGLWVPKAGGPARKLPQAGGASVSAPNAHLASAAQPHSGPARAPNGHARFTPPAQPQVSQVAPVRPQGVHAPAAKGPQPQPPSAQHSAPSAAHHRPAPSAPALGPVRSQQPPQANAQQQSQTKEQVRVETEGQAQEQGQEKGQTKGQEQAQVQENGQEKGQAQGEGPLNTDWPLPGASAPSVLSVLKALPEELQEGVFGLVAFVEENERAHKARRKKMTTLQYWHLNGTRNREAELREDEAEAVQMALARAQSCEDKQQCHALLGRLRQFLGSRYAALRAHDAEALAMVKRHIDEEHALELATREKLEGLMEAHCATSE